MGGDEEKGFVIRDRRSRGEGGGSSSEPPTAAPSFEQQAGAFAQEGTEPHETRPPVTFASFVFSLGTSAMMLMGEQLDPQQGTLPVNLPQAKEVIDILSMLESKTKSNLTADEQAVLQDMLYALRMKYVDMASGKQASKSP
ncbi:DUF1844 domain-containing protein [Nitrospiraceae bacterium AH_259_D15_M11_P09]|nr:DUF1844 domain-containing protein [Nitrospiraceae bacterium AH_259_D15_M11_P09]